MKLFLSASALFLLTACSFFSKEEEVEQIALLDGTPSSVEQIADGRLAIVNFWASWCVFCKDELPLFEDVSIEHPEIAMIAVNMQEKQKVAKKYWDAGGYTFPSLLDPNKELYLQFDVFTQPTTFFLDQEGNVVSRKDGPLNEEELDERVKELIEWEGSEMEAVSEDAEVAEVTDAGLSDDVQVSEVSSFLSGWYQGEVKHSIPLEDLMSGGPPKDGIPSIDDPKFTSVDEATYLKDDDIGILLTVEDDTRYYPMRILNWHEIVNDTVGGAPISVTFCPLCDTAVVFGRTISTGLTEFGVSGFLYQSDLVMYDRETDSLWDQVKGEAVVGPLTGEKLTWFRSDVVRFKTIKANHPSAKILSTDTGHFRDYDVIPYAGYDEQESVMFPVRATDDSVFSKERMFGIVVNGQAKAYKQSTVKEEGVINDVVSGVGIEIKWDENLEVATFTNQNTFEVIPQLPVFWFAWKAQYPDTELFE